MDQMIGFVQNIPPDKSFGFIQTEDGERYFFHQSKFRGVWRDLFLGDWVTFVLSNVGGRIQAVDVSLDFTRARKEIPVRASKPRVLGAYDGPTLDLSAERRREALEEISRWKLEARLDDVSRYFYAVPELEHIITGEASYVIGRKGTGKTALVQFISGGRRDGTLVTKLSFKSFPFNELYGQDNRNYARPNQYITVWKLIIYSAACQLIARSPNVDPLIRDKINKAFPAPDSDNLGTIIGKWIIGDIGVNVLGSGVNAGGWFKAKKSYSIQEKVDNLEAFVIKHATRDAILILFDELDEDYKEIFENFNRSEYIDLLTSLFKAVQDVRSIINKSSSKIYPFFSFAMIYTI